ncbi:MAG: alpha/beta hydrolase [Gammaproteobacteria bacterium]|nr:alpha/beta hydrolase [Gammaproteobacteria bacterium]
MSEDLNLQYVEAGDVDGDKSIIWLHGLGADGYDFEPIVPELRLDDKGIHFIFPHAPVRPVTINAGASMRAWYDIYAINAGAPEDKKGIEDSRQRIVELIEQEKNRGVKAENIIIAGFSQGGAMALHTGLHYPEKLGGILALSCYLPLMSELMAMNAEKLVVRDIPIMLVHGIHDPVVPYSMGEDSRYYLQKLGYTPQWHSYPMQHSVCPEEIDDISEWLKQVFRVN